MHLRAVEKNPKSASQPALFLLGLSLVCCVFEGAARKWAVGDGSIAGRVAYLSKDALLACFLLLGRGRANPLIRAGTPLLALGLALLAGASLISAASGVQPVGAVLTIRTFFVLPLAAFAAARVLPPETLRRFAVWITLLSLPMAALGALQFFSPSSSSINRYSTVDEAASVATAGVSERVRATGTFSYISGMTDFAVVAIWAGLVTFTLARTKRERWLGYGGLAAGACCALVTVSRTPAVIALGLAATWAIIGGKFGRKARTALTIAAAGYVALLLSGRWDAADEVASTVYLRHESAKGDSFGYRLWHQFIRPLEAIAVAPLGEGLGSKQVATSLVGKKNGDTGIFESYWGRIILELGLPGLVGFLVSCGAVFAALLAAYRAGPRGEARTVLAVTAAALGAKFLAGFQYNHVAAYFFWAMAATALASCHSSGPGRLVTKRSSKMPVIMPNQIFKNPRRDRP